jgi:hypothetical protein
METTVKYEALCSVLQVSFDAARTEAQPWTPLWMFLTLAPLGHRYRSGSLRLDQVLDMLCEFGANPQSSEKVVPNIEFTKSMLAAFAFNNSATRCPPWVDTPMEIMSALARSGKHKLDPDVAVCTLDLLDEIMGCIGQADIAERHFEASARLVRQQTPEYDQRIRLTYSNLENVRLNRGNPGGANEARLECETWLSSSSSENSIVAFCQDQPQYSCRATWSVFPAALHSENKPLAGVLSLPARTKHLAMITC